MLRTLRSRLVVVLLAVAAAAGPATPGAARPLPPPPLLAYAGSVNATIQITYVPGGAPVVTPGGDAVWAYDCVTTLGETAGEVEVTCMHDAGDGYRLSCSVVDVTAIGVDTRAMTPGTLKATGGCGDGQDRFDATVDTESRLSARKHYLRMSAAILYCRVYDVADAPYSVTCAVTASARVPIIGGVVMTQTAVGTPWSASLWGVLGDPSRWNCVMSIAMPPTVRCDAVPSADKWFCDGTVVDAVAPGPVLFSVRGQLSCDGTQTPVAPHTPSTVSGTTSLSTVEVPYATVPPPAIVTTDTYGEILDHDTTVFVCQAWGPANTPIPVAPWTVGCSEP